MPSPNAAVFTGGGESLCPLPLTLSVWVTTRLIFSPEFINDQKEGRANSGVPKNMMDKSVKPQQTYGRRFRNFYNRQDIEMAYPFCIEGKCYS
jgi:hypothetical protein